MARFIRKPVFWLAALAIALLLAWYFLGPSNQPLVSLTQSNIVPFAQSFDTNARAPRIVLLLSPT
jgi:hypothetical protein